MQRAKVICHMLTSLDGKINGRLYDCKGMAAFEKDYYDTDAAHFAPLSTLCFVGRRTAEGLGPLEEHLPAVAAEESELRTDFLTPVLSSAADGKLTCRQCFGVIDPHGRMAWKAPTMQASTGGIAALDGHHWLEVLVEEWVSDAFLAHCRRVGVPYVFAGKKEFEPAVLLQKAKALMGADTVRLFGGGVMNGLFLRADCVDELSLIVAPMVSGSPADAVVFAPASDKAEDAVPAADFTPKQMTRLESGAMWSWHVRDRSA